MYINSLHSSNYFLLCRAKTDDATPFNLKMTWLEFATGDMQMHYTFLEYTVLKQNILNWKFPWKWCVGSDKNESCELTHSFQIHPFSSTWKHKKTVRFSDVFRE